MKATIGNFGYVAHHGYNYLEVVGLKGISRDLTFPSSGWYRLKFALRSRTDTDAYANGVIQAYLERNDNTTKIARMVCPYAGNFQEYEYVFRVPERGTYKFHLEQLGKFDVEKGLSDNPSDVAMSVIDALSVRRIDWDLVETVDMAEDVQLNVESGANFHGCNAPFSIFSASAFDHASFIPSGVGTYSGNSTRRLP